MKWKVPAALVLLAILGYGGYQVYKQQLPKNVTMVVRRGEFVQQVSISGKVIPKEQIDLSFEQSGKIVAVPFAVGSHVNAGDVLASLDTAALDAQLASISANIGLQKAKLTQFVSGASLDDIRVAQTAVTNAQTSVDNAQETLTNAKQTLIDSLQSAYIKADDALTNKIDALFANPQSVNPKFSVTNTSVSASEMESVRLGFSSSLPVLNQAVTSLTTQTNTASAVTLTKTTLKQLQSFLDSVSLAVNNPNACLTTSISVCTPVSAVQKADISSARTGISAALSSVTAAEGAVNSAASALKTAQGSLQLAKDQLVLKQAPARSSDVSVYQAQITQAQASQAEIEVQRAKRRVIAPVSGVLSAVNVKVGQISTPGQMVFSLLSDDPLEIESYVPETNLPYIHVGDASDITLDAYGSDVSFRANVVSIDPSSTLREGVVTYRTLLQFEAQDNRIKTGLTANVVVNTKRKSNVIAIPQGLISLDKGYKYVRIQKDGSIENRTVTTGDVSTAGSIEITSGLQEGDVLVVKEATR